MKNLLEEAYDPEKFRRTGHQLIDLLADHLQNTNHNPQAKVNLWKTPEQQWQHWQTYRKEEGATDSLALFEDILQHSIHLHNPRYMGHQIAPSVPVSVLASLLSSSLNNGMAIYEMGAAASVIERAVVQTFTRALGYSEQADGFLTSGGTLANLTALLTARQLKGRGDIWQEGSQEKLALMVSEEAHYCVDRAARILGWGTEGIIKIPVDQDFRMRTELLESYYQEAKQKGLRVICVVGSAPSTSTGSYDPLEEIASFCKKHELWFHIDGAHGAAAVFSSRYRSRVRGIEQADSVVMDGHKMLLTPSTTTLLLYRNGPDSFQTFRQKAQYLWEENQAEEAWYNSGRRTFECTKLMMSIKLFSIVQVHGTDLFAQYLDTLYDLAQQFAELLKNRPHFEVACAPQANIVCFRYHREGLTEDDSNRLNAAIRRRILEEGIFYIVQTELNSGIYLRCSFMNPFTKPEHLEGLLKEIEDKAQQME